MKSIVTSLLTGSLLLSAAMAGETGPSTGAVAKDAPFGHPDFYPSPDRPLGWRGDGSGAWPGATLTLSTAKGASNVVWCAPMPGPSFSQPLVIGEKVITQADPNWLVCVNVHDGKILWKTEIDHTLAMEPEMREKARKEKAYIAELRREFGRYWQGVKILYRDLKKAGINPDHVFSQTKGARCWRIGEQDADDLMKASHQKVLDDPRLRAAYKALEKQSRELGFTGVTGYGSGLGLGGYGRQGKDPQHPVHKRVIDACGAYDLMAADQWGEPYTSMTFATPVTDGEAIYVTSINNAVASVDLNGTIRWIVWDRNAERERASISLGCTGTRFICSPALIRGRLIVNQNGEIRAFDPATGQKLWGGSHMGIRFGGQYPWRHYPEAPMLSSTALKLPEGGELVVIWDGGPGLWRWEDGKLLLGKGKIMQAAESATLQKLIDDIVLGWTSKSGYGSDGMWAKRLVARSRDTVELQLLWEIKKENKKNYVDWRCNAPVYLPGGKVHGAWALLDTYRLENDELAGDRLTFPSGGRDSGWPVLVGDRVVSLTENKTYLAIAPPDGRTVPVGIPDPCVDRRVAEDEAWRLDWGWQVNCQVGPSLDSPFGENILQHGLQSAQANRVFRRTRSYLWCLGDPNQPFPAPKDCPPAARIPPALPGESTRRQVLTECEGQPTETALPCLTAALADPAEALRTQALTALVKLGARAVPALLPALASPQPSVRFCAARFFAEVPTRESIEPLIRLLGDPYRDVRSAATEALAKAGPEVAKVALAALRSKEAAVRSGAVDLVGPGDDTVVTALLELLDDPEAAVRASVKKALRRTGTAVIPSLQKILQGATGLRQREAIELAGLLGDQAQSLVPVLVPLLQSSDSATLLRVIWALGEIGPAAGVALTRLLEVAREADPNDAQVPIVEAIKKIQPQSPQLELFAIIQNLRTCPGPQILKYAEQAVAKGEPIVPLLIRMLDVARPRPAGRAAVALGKLGPPAKAALPALKGLLAKTDDKPLKEALAEAIARIEGTASQP